MHWVMVEGYRMPILVSGHPALDFCNTWAGWGDPPHPRGEWLHDFDHFAVWAFHAGLVGVEEGGRVRALGRRRPGAAAGVLEEARRLRPALYRVAQDPAATRDFRTVARLAERSAAAARLVAGPGGQARWELPVSLDLPLLAVARSAAELLCEPDRPPVGRCPGTDCGWLFVNRQGHRRWCTMQYCGNRAKARAHARRRRNPAGSSSS